MEKKFNYRRIITIVMVLLFWAVILLIFVDTKPMYGKWNCGEDIVIEFNRTRTFEIYNTAKKDDVYIEGTYKAKRQKMGLPKIRYDVTLEADEEFHSDYKKELLVSLNQKNLNKMTISDKESNIEYTCKRTK